MQATAEPTAPPASEESGKPLLLVVDDDAEVVHYLEVLLTPGYHVISRFDADSAFKAVQEEAPALVPSDVVMPGETGYDLCRRLKEDLQLCHIPVVLLTAKATVKEQVEGLDFGADAYVTKPFEPSYLLALIKSQLKNRDKLNRAAEMIREGKYTFAEIADRTGFSTPSVFSTNFKKQFGMASSEY